MLRISTTVESPTLIGLKLEGQIISEWVKVLEEECFKVFQKKKNIVIDVSGVSFIDCHGVDLFKRLSGENLHVKNCSPLILEMLDECIGVESGLKL